MATKNVDKPGMVGRIGSILGQNNINIARMDLGRNISDKKAMMMISVDESVSAEVMEELKNMEGIIDISLIEI